MYTALLQNQVLGIDNPYLLHEIHNCDEIVMKDNLYSQLQRQTMSEDDSMLHTEGKKAATLFGGCGPSHDSSPFNSKYTVLKFNNLKPSSSKYSMGSI
jgi:hypothetical protein